MSLNCWRCKASTFIACMIGELITLFFYSNGNEPKSVLYYLGMLNSTRRPITKEKGKGDIRHRWWVSWRPLDHAIRNPIREYFSEPPKDFFTFIKTVGTAWGKMFILWDHPRRCERAVRFSAICDKRQLFVSLLSRVINT